MTLEWFIQTYGYWAILLGTFLEGEMVLIIAGILASQEYLQLHWILGAALIGSLLGDQLFFFVGRNRRLRYIAKKRLNFSRRLHKVQRLLEQHHIPFIFGFRFFYGMRTVAPILIGMTRIRYSTFAVFNTLSAMLWVTIVGVAGYFFGFALKVIIHKWEHYRWMLIPLAVIVALSVWLYYRHRQRCAAARAAAETQSPT